MDVETGCWSDDMLQLFEVPAQSLPEIVPSIGRCALVGADAPGCRGNTHQRHCRRHQQAALFGHLGVSSGAAKVTYGTGCFLLQHAGASRPPDIDHLLTTVALGQPDGLTYAYEGSVFTGGALVQWLRDELGLIESAPEIEGAGEIGHRFRWCGRGSRLHRPWRALLGPQRPRRNPGPHPRCQRSPPGPSRSGSHRAPGSGCPGSHARAHRTAARGRRRRGQRPALATARPPVLPVLLPDLRISKPPRLARRTWPAWPKASGPAWTSCARFAPRRRLFEAWLGDPFRRSPHLAPRRSAHPRLGRDSE